jgi:hypothetical protein
LPKDAPAKRFWSVTAYDTATAAGLAGTNKYPSISSKNNPVKNKDGSTTLYFGPKPVDGIAKENYLNTPKNKGWFALLRLYAPDKGFFERTWEPGNLKKISCEE